MTEDRVIPLTEALIDDLLDKVTPDEAAELEAKHRKALLQYADGSWTNAQFQDHALGMIIIAKLMLRKQGADHHRAATETF